MIELVKKTVYQIHEVDSNAFYANSIRNAIIPYHF